MALRGDTRPVSDRGGPDLGVCDQEPAKRLTAALRTKHRDVGAPAL